METYCDECDNLHNPKDNPYNWVCIKFRKLDGAGHLSKNYRAENPYMKCSGINGGACCCFTPKRTNQANLDLRAENEKSS